MKQLSTQEATDELFVKLRSSQCYSFTKMTYIDDDGVEIPFHDHQYPIKIKKYAEPPRYANISYVPAVSEIKFSVINRGGEYSPKNITSGKGGILVKDRVFNVYDGKKLKSQPAPQDVQLLNADAILYRMRAESEDVVPDQTNLGNDEREYFSDLFNKYDSLKYDSAKYSIDGYVIFQREFDDIWSRVYGNTLEKIKISSNTNNGLVYYRAGETLEQLDAHDNTSAGWIYAGPLVQGICEFDISITNKFAMQIAVLKSGGGWSPEDFSLWNCSVSYREPVEWVLLGSFLLDDPEFDENRASQLSEIDVKGRNAWKRALETEANLEDLSGGVPIDTILKQLADRVKLTYTATSIADLSSYGNRTLPSGYGNSEKVSKIFEDLMLIVGTEYRARISDDNILYIEPRPTEILAEISFSYRHYIEARQGSKSDRKLQRVTVVSNKCVLKEQSNLGSPTVFNTPGVQAPITWSGGAISKYWTVSGVTGTMKIVAVEMANTSITFTTSGSGSLTVQVKGNKFLSTEPTYYGEAANVYNIENVDGRTYQIENPNVVSHTECKRVCESLISEFGDPEYNVKIEDAFLNPLTEINTTATLYSRDFVELSIYVIIGIEYELKSETDKSANYELADTGKRIDSLGGIIYDRDPAIQYDRFFMYDARYAGMSQSEIDYTQYEKHNTGYL